MIDNLVAQQTTSLVTLPQSANSTQVFWQRPARNWKKLNFDGSRLDNEHAAFGFAIRDENANPVVMGAGGCGQTSVLVAEALALKEGLKAALSLGIDRLEIEGDNLCVINCLRSTWKVPWKIDFILSEIREDLCRLVEFKINHNFREANAVVDYLANKGHLYPTLTKWFECPDFELAHLIRKDELGWVFLRH